MIIRSHAERVEAALKTPAVMRNIDGKLVMAQAPFLDQEIPADANEQYRVEISDHKRSPSIVYAHTIDALRTIAMEYSRLEMQGQPLVRLEERLEHLRQHGDAIIQLGGKAIFGLQVFSTVDGMHRDAAFIFAPTELSTNLLGIALIAGYPEVPTREDMQLVEALGLKRGISELRVYAQAYEMPEPLAPDEVLVN